jgi:hypothetical protein
MQSRRFRRVVPWLLLALGCVAAYAIGQALPGVLPGTPSGVALAADEALAPVFAVQEGEQAGLSTGKLLAGEQVLLEIVAAAGALNGHERALIVADRLNRRLEQGATTANFTAGVENGEGRLLFDQATVILTVTEADAQQAGKSVPELTNQWTEAILGALPADAAPAATDSAPATDPPATTAQAQPTEWRPRERYDDKYVPVIGYANGVRVGVARVNGPVSKLARTQAVARLDLSFHDALQIEVYVPISTKEPGKKLARVQSVGVTGLGDLKL